MYHGGLEFYTLLTVYAVSVVRFQFHFLIDNYMTEKDNEEQSFLVIGCNIEK